MKTSHVDPKRTHRKTASHFKAMVVVEKGPDTDRFGKPKNEKPVPAIPPEYHDIIKALYARGYKGATIHRFLTSKEEMETRGLAAIRTTYTLIYKLVESFDQAELKTIRAKFLETMEDVRLTKKIERCLELQKIVDNKNTLTKDRIAALKAIRDEIGEDVDKLVAGLRDAAAPTISIEVHNNYNNLNEQDKRQYDANLAAILSRRGAVTRVNDN